MSSGGAAGSEGGRVLVRGGDGLYASPGGSVVVEAGSSARARSGNLVLISGANLAKCLNNTKNGASFFFLVAISRIVLFLLEVDLE